MKNVHTLQNGRWFPPGLMLDEHQERAMGRPSVE